MRRPPRRLENASAAGAIATLYPIGMATKWVFAAVFTCISTACLPPDFASDSALRKSATLPMLLPPTSRITSPDLRRRRTVRIDPGYHKALVAGRLVRRRNGEAEMRHVRHGIILRFVGVGLLLWRVRHRGERDVNRP